MHKKFLDFFFFFTTLMLKHAEMKLQQALEGLGLIFLVIAQCMYSDIWKAISNFTPFGLRAGLAYQRIVPRGWQPMKPFLRPLNYFILNYEFPSISFATWSIFEVSEFFLPHPVSRPSPHTCIIPFCLS